MESFNEQQREIIVAPFKPTLVIAGAGTGKTTVLAARFKYLLEKLDINPGRVLILTSTNSGQLSILSKINLPADNLNIFTFHKFGKTYLEEWSNEKYKVCNRERQTEVLSDIKKNLNLKISIKGAQEIIIHIKSLEKREINDEEIIDIGRKIYRNFSDKEILSYIPREEIQKLLNMYEKFLYEENRIDFEDMQVKIKNLLRVSSIFRSWISNKFDAIFIDEFQDLKKIQFQILTKLAPKNSRIKNVFCIGDPNQNIYKFLGALKNSFYAFSEYYEDVSIYKLEINYRSSPEIIEVANKLIDNDEFDLLLKAHKESSGQTVSCNSFRNYTEEDNFVIFKIKELAKSGIPIANIAVLSRTRKDLNYIKRKLHEYSIPCTEKTRFENHYFPGVYTETIHSSKGLEFEYVFVTRMSEGKLPHIFAIKDSLKAKDPQQKILEEQNIAYVATTRAKEKLYITYSREESRFISSLTSPSEY